MHATTGVSSNLCRWHFIPDCAEIWHRAANKTQNIAPRMMWKLNKNTLELPKMSLEPMTLHRIFGLMAKCTKMVLQNMITEEINNANAKSFVMSKSKSKSRWSLWTHPAFTDYRPKPTFQHQPRAVWRKLPLSSFSLQETDAKCFSNTFQLEWTKIGLGGQCTLRCLPLPCSLHLKTLHQQEAPGSRCNGPFRGGIKCILHVFEYCKRGRPD